MNERTFKKIKILTTSFISATVAIAVTMDNIFLAIAGVLIGLLFLVFVKRKTSAVLVDERINTLSEKAARLTYVITTMFLAFLSMVFVSLGRKSGEAHLEGLGIILSYIALFNLAVYAIVYKFFNKKYGGDDQE